MMGEEETNLGGEMNKDQREDRSESHNIPEKFVRSNNAQIIQFVGGFIHTIGFSLQN